MTLHITKRRFGWATFTLATALLYAGCTDPSGPGAGGQPPITDPTQSRDLSHPRGPDEAVVRVEVGGGFVSYEHHLRGVAAFTLLGDGTVPLVFRPVLPGDPGATADPAVLASAL